ncbi:hypothetical protein P152DRAFT_508721 [Eremomyces bilateralis CBS 781.70]|uniref:Uncharacterized protein n=1 Tax=Eremomyces bilateralis CBS 781.70 TaxID=1392243 RepID=A0A6G1FX00_9PEZI|nr:uncharacterized protein P152DRAFT_508721 [Eremomyces bilateralis CBS 781.70]KAF1810415.1 hypothetical protein P152DRAFT_508721 [Eremomyces bilateralis CBS 781.70]
MSFPKLQPAMTVLVQIAAPMAVGSGSKGTPLNVIPMTSGTIKSEPGFEPALDAVLDGVGYDYIRNDGSGEHMRLDVRSQVKNSDGTLLALFYKGAVALSPGVTAILSGAADAKTTGFGDSFVTMKFETGSPAYKSLETMLLVAQGRFVKEADGGITVEYRVSKVLAG